MLVVIFNFTSKYFKGKENFKIINFIKNNKYEKHNENKFTEIVICLSSQKSSVLLYL